MRQTEERYTFTVDGRKIKLSSSELLLCIMQWMRDVYGDAQQMQFRESMIKFAISEGTADLEERAREAKIYAEIAAEKEEEEEQELETWFEIMSEEE